MRHLSILLVAAVALTFATTARAQSGLASSANEAVKITQAREANAKLMRQYTWNCRTAVTVNGEVKDSRIELVHYTLDGQLQRSILNDQSPPLRGGPFLRAIERSKQQEMEEYLRGLKSQLDQYTLPTAGNILDFMNGATTNGPDASGLFEMTKMNVVVQGDTLTVWSDAKTRHTRRIRVETFYQTDVVELTANFATLQSGLNYMADANVQIPSKQIQITMENFNYTRPN